MLLRAICFLAIGLSQVTANPLPDSAVTPTDTNELAPPLLPNPCQNHRCPPNFTAVFYPNKLVCLCKPSDALPTIKPGDREACRRLRCAFPVWHPDTETCTCESTIFIDPILTTAAVVPRQTPFPPQCLAVECITDTTVVWDPKTKKCSCVPNTPDPSTCPTIKCTSDTHPYYNPDTKQCSCVPYPPDPSTCPDIRCMEGTKPTYHNDGKRCTCEPIAPRDTCSLFCGSGSTPVVNPVTKKCFCKVTNPIPPFCPKFKCLQNNHVVYHPETRKCGCEPNCPDLFCIATTIPTFNPKTNVCSCEPIPREQAQKKRDLEEREPPRLPTPTSDSHPHKPCSLLCIAEKTPKYNVTTGECECVWIPGLEPSAAPAPLGARQCKIFCEFGLVPGKCRCNPEPEMQCKKFCEFGFVPGKFCECNPEPVPHCKMFCEFGFVPGKFCECNPKPIVQCLMFCEFGFVPGKCKCKSKPEN